MNDHDRDGDDDDDDDGDNGDDDGDDDVDDCQMCACTDFVPLARRILLLMYQAHVLIIF